MSFIRSGGAIQNLLYSIAGEKYENLVTIALAWKKIVGNIVAERSEIQKIDNNILFIAVNNSVWLQEMVLTKKIIIAKIKQRLGIELKDIVFFLKNF